MGRGIVEQYKIGEHLDGTVGNITVDEGFFKRPVFEPKQEPTILGENRLHIFDSRHSSLHRGDNRVVICAPRSFAKSTVFSKIYPLYLICNGHPERTVKKIMLISSTGALAEHWLREIKREIDENRFLKNDFGNLTSAKWTQDHIIAHNRADNRKIEIMAKGRGYQTRGWRPDVVILDDLEDDGKASFRLILDRYFYDMGFDPKAENVQNKG